MKLYVINQDTRYFDGIKEVPDNSVGFPPGTSTIAIPELASGEYAVWNGGGWDIISFPPPIKVYMINPDTSYFDGTSFVEATTTEFDPNVTTVPVPYLQSDQYAVWSGQDWYIVNEPPALQTEG